ncbi:hypothetical protein V1477_007764 [Vespula maculifrons]|uniref:Uncharacterized protein n=1 Tax=Vespula maculifrons TaxID=7453 RepID=A0ABD2CFP0_VESMC
MVSDSGAFQAKSHPPPIKKSHRRSMDFHMQQTRRDYTQDRPSEKIVPNLLMLLIWKNGKV